MKKFGVFYIATLDVNQPKGRPFSSITEFERKSYLCTNNTKDVYKQIMNNTKVEIIGMGKDRVAMLEEPTGPSNLYKIKDGVFYLENAKAIKYSMINEPVEIK